MPDRLLRWLTAALGLPEGLTPFPWQVRLLSHLQQDRAPSALDLPTGLGKTSVMAIWLVARAHGAPVPRRLVYVVDRRAVVDQATAVAEQLRAWVRGDPEVQAALGLTGPLPISTLRGQHADNRLWLADPTSPAIVLGTVDMVGSRLLFSGYGVSSRMRPYHAGLIGVDSLIVLDEAHLVPPFERLVSQVATGCDAVGRPLGPAAADDRGTLPPLRVMSLSATGHAPANGRTFTLESADRAHPVVQQRLAARKRLMLLPEVQAKDLPESLAAHAWDLVGKGRRPARVIVFVNSREHAQKVKMALDKRLGPAGQSELFVGGRRVFEREEAARRLKALGYIAGSDVPAERPVFLVATSAAEVGVDLDADHAVCDAVAWERMVQRLGRINRRGAGDAAVIVVPAVRDDEPAQARLAALIELMQALPRHADGSLDGSPAALSALKGRPELQDLMARASTPAPLHPPLSRALVEAWAMTSLEEHSGRPEVAPWLRGWPDEEEVPQTTVVWRRHLPVTDDPQGRLLGPRDLQMFQEAAGPHLVETLTTDMPQVRDWLLARAQAVQDPKPRDEAPESDVSPLHEDNVLGVVLHDSAAEARLLRAADVLQAARRDLERLLAGATLMVDRRLGGLAAGLLAHDAADAVLDVTDAADESGTGPVPFRVARVEAEEVEHVVPGWRTEASFPVKQTEEGVLAWLVVRSRVDQQAGSEEGRAGALRQQLLSEHQAWTAATARRIALSMGLPDMLVEMLTLAAALHDEGKRALRWQRAFHAPGRGDPPYAKTVGRPDLALLDGYRHEFGSLPLAEADARVQALPADLRALCLHLIAAHHGAARPLIRTQGASEPPSRAELRAQEVALRYSSLNKVWGPWGLAWWEALLRAADQQASRRNDEEGIDRG